MGWDFQHKDPGTTAADVLRRDYPSITDIACKGSTAYAAYRTDDGRTIGIVFLLAHRPKDHYNFGYKTIDEGMGPNESECPERILQQLSPTDSEYALRWRERCRQNLQRPTLRDGSKIRLAEPCQFTDRAALQEFTVRKLGRRTLYQAASGGYYRIPKWRLQTAEILQET